MLCGAWPMVSRALFWLERTSSRLSFHSMADFTDYIPLRIGDCRFDPRSHEIERGGVVVRLPHKQSALLWQLASMAPQVLSRQTLIDLVWDRRMVEEAVLSRAIAELRRALDDDRRESRYIETIPKSGYRLCAPVSIWADAGQATGTAVPDGHPEPAIGARASGRRNTFAFGLASLVILGLSLGLWRWFATPVETERPTELLGVADLARIRPLTSDPGYEYRADLSADGRWLVYTQSDLEGGVSRLMLQDIDGHHRESLTASGEHEFRPALAPDGKQIAFLRSDDSRCSLHVRPTSAGLERRLAECGFPAATPAWSADQNSLVFTAAAEPGFAPGLSVVDLHTGKILALTQPSLAMGPDRDPEWVPKQRKISFARGYDGEQHLMQIDLDSPHTEGRVLFDAGRLQGHAWFHDGTRLLVASDAPGYRTLMLLDADGRQLAVLNTRGAQFPAWAQNGELVFEQAQYDANIERMDLAGREKRSVPVITSTRYDASPVLSPDGQSLAFVSNREDFEQVYVVGLDGQNMTRIQFTEGSRWSRPAFSPDGRFIVATGYDTDHTNWIYRFDRLREQSERLQELGAHATGARYHPDNTGLVYMRRNEQGERSLWRLDSGPGQIPSRIMNTDGVEHFEWLGSDLVIKRRNRNGFELIHGKDLETIEPVLAELTPISPGAWTIRNRHLFVVVREAGRHVLKRGDVDSGLVIDIASPVDADAVGPSLAVSADEQTVWFARTVSLQIDLMRLPAIQAQ